MIKTSVVRQVSVDDVRGIPHLTAISMMTTDVFDKIGDFNYLDREDFINLINNYTMRCDPLSNSIEYFTNGAPQKRVVISPAGFEGIKIEYYLGTDKRVVTWSFDDYAELAGDWGSGFEDDDEWDK